MQDEHGRHKKCEYKRKDQGLLIFFPFRGSFSFRVMEKHGDHDEVLQRQNDILTINPEAKIGMQPICQAHTCHEELHILVCTSRLLPKYESPNTLLFL